MVSMTERARKKDEGLTPLELQILQCCADGLRADQIPNIVFRAKGTVDQYKFHIMRKLNTRTTAGAVAIGFRTGILK